MEKISELPKEKIDDLCSTLEKAPTADWRRLMTKGFGSLYTQQDIEIIEGRRGSHPAKDLLEDLICREVSLQELVDALGVIGNKRAISIIEKDKAKKNGFNISDCGRPPSRSIIRQPAQEHTMPTSSSFTPLLQREEQTETLPFPVQESSTREESPRGPCRFFSCLYVHLN